VRITSVTDNYRKKALEVVAGGKSFDFPYEKLRLRPNAANRVAEAAPDPEIGNEAFTYRLQSGEEDTVHLDAVLEVNQDPEYLQGLLLHRLTVEARAALKSRRLGVRAIARRLRTSPSQVYRLLDANQSKKSLGQLLALLSMVDREVELVVRATKRDTPRPRKSAARRVASKR
jgi:hypothetical protein